MHSAIAPGRRRWMAGTGLFAAALLFAAGCAEPSPAPAAARTATGFSPQLTPEGRLRLPDGAQWREWPYVGTPLTPNALNEGEAPFPEFHSVYIDPESWEHWRATGEFRDGTVLAKELVSVRDSNAFPDGSTRQVSGRGYFMGEFIGFEIAWKSDRHFPDEPGHWGYFSFGHHPPPYAETTEKMPAASCNACHQAEAARAPGDEGLRHSPWN